VLVPLSGFSQVFPEQRYQQVECIDGLQNNECNKITLLSNQFNILVFLKKKFEFNNLHKIKLRNPNSLCHDFHFLKMQPKLSGKLFNFSFNIGKYFINIIIY